MSKGRKRKRPIKRRKIVAQRRAGRRNKYAHLSSVSDEERRRLQGADPLEIGNLDIDEINKPWYV